MLHRWSVEPAAPPVTVVQALPKSDRSELAIELATEAGADGFVAWQASRCVARWEGPRMDKGLRRWRAVARSAARQSRRPHIPCVEGMVSTAALAQRVRNEVTSSAVVLALHQDATVALTDVRLAQANSLTLLGRPGGRNRRRRDRRSTRRRSGLSQARPDRPADLDGGRGRAGCPGSADPVVGAGRNRRDRSQVVWRLKHWV